MQPGYCEAECPHNPDSEAESPGARLPADRKKKHMDKHDLINQLQLDTMAEHFEKAISQAADALQEKGYKNAGTIRDRILETSGYRYL